MTRLLLAALLLGGCAAPSTDPDPLRISPNVPDHVRAAFHQAGRDWNRSQGLFDVVVTDRPDSHGQWNVNGVHAWDIPGKWGMYRGRIGTLAGAFIEVRFDVPADIAWQIAAHEIGHYLGWEEHAQGGVMRDKTDASLECIDLEAAAIFGGVGNCELDAPRP